MSSIGRILGRLSGLGADPANPLGNNPATGMPFQVPQYNTPTGAAPLSAGNSSDPLGVATAFAQGAAAAAPTVIADWNAIRMAPLQAKVDLAKQKLLTQTQSQLDLANAKQHLTQTEKPWGQYVLLGVGVIVIGSVVFAILGKKKR